LAETERGKGKDHGMERITERRGGLYAYIEDVATSITNTYIEDVATSISTDC
jgi:hypothetical protein